MNCPYVSLVAAHMWLVVIHILCSIIYDTSFPILYSQMSLIKSLIQQLFIEHLPCAMNVLSTKDIYKQ